MAESGKFLWHRRYYLCKGLVEAYVLQRNHVNSYLKVKEIATLSVNYVNSPIRPNHFKNVDLQKVV